jgi:hypothetical protein
VTFVTPAPPSPIAGQITLLFMGSFGFHGVINSLADHPARKFIDQSLDNTFGFWYNVRYNEHDTLTPRRSRQDAQRSSQ